MTGGRRWSLNSRYRKFKRFAVRTCTDAKFCAHVRPELMAKTLRPGISIHGLTFKPIKLNTRRGRKSIRRDR